METGQYGRRGSPWEFNLRDVFRWCELMLREQPPVGSSSSSRSGLRDGVWEPWLLVDTLYIQRMRTRADREAVLRRFQEVFPEVNHLESGSVRIGAHPVLKVFPEWMQVGQTVLPRGCWASSYSSGAWCVDDLKSGLPIPLALRRPLEALAR